MSLAVQHNVLLGAEVNLVPGHRRSQQHQLRLNTQVGGVGKVVGVDEVADGLLVVQLLQCVKALVVIALVNAQLPVLIALGTGLKALLRLFVVAFLQQLLAQRVIALVQALLKAGIRLRALFIIGQGLLVVPLGVGILPLAVADFVQHFVGVPIAVGVCKEGGGNGFQAGPVGGLRQMVVEHIRPGERNTGKEQSEDDQHQQRSQGLFQGCPAGQGLFALLGQLVRIPVAGNPLKGPGGLKPIVAGAGAFLLSHGLCVGVLIALGSDLLRQFGIGLCQLRRVVVILGSGEHIRGFLIVQRPLLEGDGALSAGDVLLSPIVELLGGLWGLEAQLQLFFLLSGLFGIDDLFQRLNAQIAVGDLFGYLHVLFGLLLGRFGLQSKVFRFRLFGSRILDLRLVCRLLSFRLVRRLAHLGLVCRLGDVGFLCFVHVVLHSAASYWPFGPAQRFKTAKKALPYASDTRYRCRILHDLKALKCKIKAGS